MTHTDTQTLIHTKKIPGTGECVWQVQLQKRAGKWSLELHRTLLGLGGFRLCLQATCCKWGSPPQSWQVRYSKCLSKVSSQNQAFDNILWLSVGNIQFASWPSNKAKHIQEVQLPLSDSKGTALLISGWHAERTKKRNNIAYDQKTVKKIKQWKSLI